MRSPLRTPDPEAWSRSFPHGVGASAFSAPAWQALMRAEQGPGWKLCFLRAEAPDGARHLPVLARRTRFRRWHLATWPVAYFVAPIEGELRTPAELEALLCSASHPSISMLVLWLPPWLAFRPEALDRRMSVLTVQREETFVIRLEEGAEAHLARHLDRNRRRGLLHNDRAGLELVTRPSPALRDAYWALYRSAHAERGFIGPLFSRAFFEGVAEQLDQGGELCVAVRGERVVGGGVLLYDDTAVHYFQGAVDRDVRDVSPHDALYLRALREAERRGLGIVHLGGVNPGNEGLVRFKRSWGARAEPFWSLAWRHGPGVLARRVLARDRATREGDAA